MYFAASLAHFSHNAEYIAYYPNMPGWLDRENVYLAWLVVTAVGVGGLVATRMRWRGIGAILIAAYGALGLDGLAHYTLALCSEHTLVTNITIWAEGVSGTAPAAGIVHSCRKVLASAAGGLKPALRPGGGLAGFWASLPGRNTDYVPAPVWPAYAGTPSEPQPRTWRSIATEYAFFFGIAILGTAAM